MNLFLTAGGGFLIAVIWMDLMFDVLAFGPRTSGPAANELEADSLDRIATYYRRVTTTAWPMNQLVGAVMTTMVAVLILQLVRGEGDARLAAISLGLCGVPIGLALIRVFPNAVRLGTRSDPAAEQTRLARAILVDHIFCITAMVVFLVLRLGSGAN